MSAETFRYPVELLEMTWHVETVLCKMSIRRVFAY